MHALRLNSTTHDDVSAGRRRTGGARPLRRLGTIALVAAVALALPTAAIAAAPQQGRHPGNVVVSPTGNDAAAGTAGHPIRTVAEATRRLTRDGGGTMALRGGTYHERVVLNAVHDIRIVAYHREHPILSGAGLRPPAGLTAMVSISASRNITVDGLDITGYRTRSLGHVPAGIVVTGGDSDIVISDNHVHHLGNDNTTLGSFDINAHGIAVYGDNPARPISGLEITNNEVDHLVLGASESVVVNGNVDGWAITSNFIHDNNNIGIDAIGYEPTLPAPYRYTDTNRARHGVIARNRVTNIISEGNPAYYEDGGYCNCADGVYIDGGTHIAVAANTMTRDDIGLEVAAENPRGSADHINSSRNTISRSAYVGIATGGYCDGGKDCGDTTTGQAHDNSFTHNTLTENNQLNDGSPEILVQFYVRSTLFADNHITTNKPEIYGVPSRSDRLSGGNHSDHNRFTLIRIPAAQATFGWLGHTYTGFSSYQRHTGQDRHSTISTVH